MPPSPAQFAPHLLRRVSLRNYRSIKACDVDLGPLTFLVGPNGAGKSNFLDALRFTTDALHTSPQDAIYERGGLANLLHRARASSTHFAIQLDLDIGRPASFAFVLEATEQGSFRIQREKCTVGDATYDVRGGALVQAPRDLMPPAAADRLYLVNAAGLPEFRPVYDALGSMGFYNLDPTLLRNFQRLDAGDILARNGRNLASVLERLARRRPPREHDRIREYLARIVPGIVDVRARHEGPVEAIEFTQAASVDEGSEDVRFPAFAMSDGTLRALGILVALFQGTPDRPARVIGIEEPETALHPAAAGVLRDALHEAAADAQVIVTSHSPDLLDSVELHEGALRAVRLERGETFIDRIDDASREALKQRLYNAGDLLRMAQLEPRPRDGRASAAGLPLFRDDAEPRE